MTRRARERSGAARRPLTMHLDGYKVTRRSESNLTAGAGPLATIARAVTGLEARFIGDERGRLPAGASLVCRLRRQEAA